MPFFQFLVSFSLYFDRIAINMAVNLLIPYISAPACHLHSPPSSSSHFLRLPWLVQFLVSVSIVVLSETRTSLPKRFNPNVNCICLESACGGHVFEKVEVIIDIFVSVKLNFFFKIFSSMELEMVQIYENSSLSANYLAPTLILRNAIMNIQICQLFY